MQLFFETIYLLFIDMGFYLILGITLVGIFNLFMRKEFIADHLGGNSLWASIKACLFGVPLPLCSCAVVPTGIYLKDKGASTATTSAFLISTPQTGVDSIVATYGLMGPTFAWFRPVAAFFSGVIGGAIVGLFSGKDARPRNEMDSTPDHAHDHEHDEASTCTTSSCSGDSCCSTSAPTEHMSIKERIISTLRYSYVETIADISVHFVVGLVIAALISVLLPPDFLVGLGLSSGLFSMIIMILVGLPMYICSTASIPIALTLMAKGVSPGAAFVFLFMGPFTNAASLSILAKKLGKRVVALYVTVAMLSAIGFGFLLDFLVAQFNLPITAHLGGHGGHEAISVFKLIVAAIFFILLIYALGVKFMNWFKSKQSEKSATGEARKFKVTGMSCGHCSSHVQADLLKNDQIDSAQVDHVEGVALVWGNADDQTVINIIVEAGYQAEVMA